MPVYYPRHESHRPQGYKFAHHQGNNKNELRILNELRCIIIFCCCCFFVILTRSSGRHLSPAVTQRSSVGPMPWLQAGEVRRNVHGKNLYRASSSFTCDTGYLSFKQQAGACVQASNDIDTIWGGGE